MSKEYIIINPAAGGVARTIKTSIARCCFANAVNKEGYKETFIMERETEPNVLRMERTEEERQRRHNEGDKGAKFSAAKELKPRRDGISNTLTSSTKDNLLLEKDGRKKAFEQAEKICENLRGGSKPVMKADGTIRGVNNRDPKHGNIGEFVAQNENNPAMTVTTAHAPKCYGESTGWRIRKLTPRECFRLMDVDDADIDKIQAAGIPKTKQYCLAGNSVVTACWQFIMYQLFIDQSNKSKQLSLW